RQREPRVETSSAQVVVADHLERGGKEGGIGPRRGEARGGEGDRKQDEARRAPACRGGIYHEVDVRAPRVRKLILRQLPDGDRADRQALERGDTGRPAGWAEAVQRAGSLHPRAVGAAALGAGA